MKKHVFLAQLLIALFVLSCADDDGGTDTETLGNWTKVSPFKGRPRSGAVMFTIGNRAFVGLGYDGDEYISDFYAFDIQQGFWETRRSFPGVLRERAVAFSANGKGYIGLGYNRELSKEELGDFWEYDPDTDVWTRIADFPSTARYNAVAFAIGTKAYIGTGYDGDKYNGDFWEYDAAQQSWREIQSYPGEKIERGLAFVVNGKGYVCTGRNNGLYNLDFWEFDPEAVTWTRRTPSSTASSYDEFGLAVKRHDAVSFVLGDYAYIMGGISSSGATDKTVIEFNSTNFEWTQKTSFEGSARSMAVTFVLDGRIFAGTGQNGSSYYDDIWEFKPFQQYDDEN